MTMVFDEDLELDEEDFESMQKAGFNEEEAIAFKGVGYVIDIPFAWGFEVLLIEFKEDLELDEEDFESMEEFNEEEAIAFKGVYSYYDQNMGKGDGKCTPALVKTMVKALGIEMEKKDEHTLAIMLEECDENKDGSCQFPEFLLLISRMQESNFCGMNDAAADRVKLEEEAGEKKRKAMQRKEGEKAAHRASVMHSTDPNKIAEHLAAQKAAEQGKEDSEEEVVELDPTKLVNLKKYSEEKDGNYAFFYWKWHKNYLDRCREECATWAPKGGRGAKQRLPGSAAAKKEGSHGRDGGSSSDEGGGSQTMGGNRRRSSVSELPQRRRSIQDTMMY